MALALNIFESVIGHGPTNQFLISYLAWIIKEYLGEILPPKVLEIERRVGGQAKLQKLVKERANQEWKASHTNACVTCFIPVKKIDSCS
ncbi:hypothetical protein PtA15_4A221 [Puccinia triticina]|uniref:Uncharacterized protein n=1 Tax=Puccinia triticina TaxID=208348 RepID=A0ABY7CLW3_9BASI|nr:uncharacterized protein PtA15_4A221 [Puccinia triticina]WAQ83772.1 hypothetical protein PtA15_4A221 [Puccinia triticina]WAR54615.1 hypothetical protein PtB15_4B232 [Puccinia triticina]